MASSLTPPVGESIAFAATQQAPALDPSATAPPDEPPGRSGFPSADLSGLTIAGRYEVLEKIGQGGMGEVYVARHKTLGSRFAIKVMRHAWASEDSDRFLREARLASKISHPNTVYIADFGVLPDGRSYLVMEFLRGRTLAAVIRQSPIPAQRACTIAAQIAHGLHAVHRQGIIHRDLKPENVFLLEEEGRPDFVKIVDFGIAKLADGNVDVLQSLPPAMTTSTMGSLPPRVGGREVVLELTQAGSVMGTPYYLSPEQARGAAVDFRADQYSLGCILYEMLCGSVPFTDTTLAGLLHKHMQEAPQSLSQRASERRIPLSVEAAVLRLLSKNPEDRYRSMQAAAQALEREAAALGSGLRHQRLWLVGGVTGLLALILGVAALQHRLRRPIDPQMLEPELSAAEFMTAKGRARAILTEQLESPDRSQRRSVLGALGQCRDSSLLEPILAVLRGPDLELQAEAATTLGQLGDRRTLPVLQQLLESAPPRLRPSVARALLDLGDPAGRSVLTTLLHSTRSDPASQETRVQAAFLLCDCDEPEAQRLLSDLSELGSTQDAAVLDILTCLGRSPQPTAARAKLLMRFRAAHGAERIPLAARLAQLGEVEGRDFLRQLASRSGSEQLLAARALAAPDEPQLLPLFRRSLRTSPHSSIRQLAASGLGVIGEPGDIRALAAPLATERDPSLLRTLAAAILSIAGREPAALSADSLRWAEQALENPSWVVRADAVAVLAYSKSRGAVALLGRMLHDRTAAVRRSAALALGRRQEQAALALLQSGLSDPDDGVRSEVLKAILRIGRYLHGQGFPIAAMVDSWLAASGTVFALPDWQRSALLLALGDDKQAVAFHAWQQQALPDQQKLLFDLGINDHEWLLSCLRSPDAAVRLLAAQRLTLGKDGSGRSILVEALQRGAKEALPSYGALARLGEPVPIDTLQLSLRPGAELAERLAAVAMSDGLPWESALLLWQRAARDPDPAVRRTLLEVLGQLTAPTLRQRALPLLRLLLHDPDPATRAQAAALLGQDAPTSTPVDMPPPHAPAPPSPAAPTAESSDDDTVANAPAERNLAPAELALREGMTAQQQHQLGRARKLLLRARALCAAMRPPTERCRQLQSEATWQLGQLYESQQQSPEAMVEYQRLAESKSFAASGGERPLLLQKAILRLSLQLGQVLIHAPAGKRCKQETQWLLPGPKTLIIEGQPTTIHITAGQKQEFGRCP